MNPRLAQIALDRPIRSRRRVNSFAVFAWLFAAFNVVFCFVFAPQFVETQGAFSALATVVFFGGLAAASVWFGFRIHASALQIGPRSVVVRNPLRRYAAPLEEVVGFETGNVTPRARNGTPGILLRLRSGRELPVWALAEEASVFSVKQRIARYEPLVQDLNELLASARGVSAR